MFHFILLLQLSHMYRNKQCGLCGHFDMEPNDEFRTPDLTLTEDVREFYLTYITKGKDCRYPEMNTLCTDASCRYKPYWETTDEIQSSYGMHNLHSFSFLFLIHSGKHLEQDCSESSGPDPGSNL